MSKFKSINYSRVVCEDCGAVTTIEPGREFSGLNCTCNQNTVRDNPLGRLHKCADTEISTPVQQELDYVKTQTVTIIGRFENGDYEVCNSNNLDDTWRVPKDTFEGTYKEVTTDETHTNDANTEQETTLKHDGSTYTISLEDLVALSAEDIKAKFNMDELRVLARTVKIRGASQMNEDKLVGKLLTKAE